MEAVSGVRRPRGGQNLFVVAALGIALVAPALAQTIFTGELTGIVLDPSEAVIASANVELSSGDTGQKFSTKSDATGEFRFPLLRPGNYRLTVTISGFEPKIQPATVALGQSSNFRIQLGIQAGRETVPVSDEAPLLQSNDANLATTLNQRQIENLPIPGNDLTVFAFTAPGVTLNSASGTGNFSVHGLPSISNVFTINGADITDPYAHLNPVGASNLSLGANEIQEAAVVVNGYTGQYGRLAGANVNYVTKTGTNSFHGNAAWYYNGRSLDANAWFNNATGTPRPFAISNHWADSLGGPVLKDKLFFFFNNEGLRYVLPAGGPVFIPTADFSKFVLTGLAANNPSAVPLYTTALNLYAGASGASRATPVTAASDPSLGCGDFKDPIYGVSKPCAATFQNTVNSLNTEWLAAAKIDYNVSRNDRVYLRLNTDHGLQATYTDPINPAFNIDSNQPAYGGQFGYTRIITPHSMNALLLSAGYNAAVYSSLNLALRTFPTTMYFNDGPPFANLGGFDDLFPQGIKLRVWQLVDDYSFIHGRHTLKAGVNVRKNFESTYFYGQETSGALTFNSMTDFVNGSLNNGSSYVQAFSAVGAENLTYYSAGFYGQDEWRVRPNLTATLALRMDRNSNVTCAGGCFTELTGQGAFATIAHSASIPYNQVIQTGLKQAFHQVDAIIPEPRLGVAYSIDRSTVLRGGLGIFSDSNPGLLADRFITNSPTVSLFTTSSGLVATGDPNGVFSQVANSNTALRQGFASGATLNQLQAQVPLFQVPNFFTSAGHSYSPKYYEWNVEVQRELRGKYALSVNYVGNHGVDEGVQQVSGNGFSTAGFAGLPSSAPDLRFGQIIEFYNQGWSNYDGLVTSFKWRMNARFSGQFSYTWSHALDTCSNDCVPEAFNQGSAPSYRFQFNPLSLRSLNYSNADYDVRHSVNANYIYSLPPRFSHGVVLNAILGGWTAAGTVYYHSSYPFSIVNPAVQNEVNQLGNLAGKVNQPFLADFLGGSSYPSCTAPNVSCYSRSQFATGAAQHDFGNIPRNSFRGPGFFDTDLSVNKAVAISEHWKLLVGASLFNLFNHPNFDLPVNNLASGVFGQIVSTVSAPSSAYGSSPGAISSVSGRVIQTSVKLSF
jgi:hypothetical protein